MRDNDAWANYFGQVPMRTQHGHGSQNAGFPPFGTVIPLFRYGQNGCELTARRADRAVPVELRRFLAVIHATILLLCRRHHRAVHEGRVKVGTNRDGAVLFFTRTGRILVDVPERSRPMPGSSRDAGLAPVPAENPSLPPIPTAELGLAFQRGRALPGLGRPVGCRGRRQGGCGGVVPTRVTRGLDGMRG